jgi:hypothetical protein
MSITGYQLVEDIPTDIIGFTEVVKSGNLLRHALNHDPGQILIHLKPRE